MKKTEIQIIEEKLTSLENNILEFKTEVINKLNSMNKYYATVISQQIMVKDKRVKELPPSKSKIPKVDVPVIKTKKKKKSKK